MRIGRIAGTVLAAALLSPAATAHDLRILDARLTLSDGDRYTAELKVDVDALALGASPSASSFDLATALLQMEPDEFDDAVERAAQTVLRRVRIRFDGTPSTPELAFPDAGDELVLVDGQPTVLGLVARLEGDIPPDSRELTFFASRAMGPVQLLVTDERSDRRMELPLQAGERSPPFSLTGPVVSPGRLEVARRYLALGFTHILPLGLDHILFVLGLFLLSTKAGPLLWQVSAFTVAHTLTLGLAIYGVVSLPSRVVESLIALSIAWIAVENVVVSEMKPWRPIIVFAFGLLHGLGFAGVLTELGLPDDRLVAALLSFNVGVELGQLAVIAIAFLLVGTLRRREWYRSRIVIPASIAIALVGIYWTIDRLSG